MKYLKFILPLFLFLSCTKSSEQPTECVEKLLNSFELTKYEGQDLPAICRFYLHKYEWKGEEWFILENPCIDMNLVAINCDEDECASIWGAECGSFSIKATYIEIVGFSE